MTPLGSLTKASMDMTSASAVNDTGVIIRTCRYEVTNNALWYTWDIGEVDGSQ